MGTSLPDEVLQRIVRGFQATSTPSQLARLALALPTQVRLALDIRPVFTSSTGAKRYLHALGNNKEGRARSLTVRRGTRTTTRTTGRRKAQDLVEDAVTPEELVRLAEQLKELVEIHLLEPAFDTLRRRQVDFAAHLPHLRTLSIAGRAGDGEPGFSLQTVGQILQGLPDLAELALRNLHCYPSALAGLSPPSCQLASLAIFTAFSISPRQLHWLLRSSIYADSVHTLAFDLPPHIPPSRLAAVKWAATPVTSLAVTASRAEVIEGMPQHFPSLRRYAFRCASPVDPHRLLASCASCGSVEVIENRSADGGTKPFVWAAALLYARRLPGLAKLQRLSLATQCREEDGFAVLAEVCGVLGLQLELFALEPHADKLPWIPASFAQLRPLTFDSSP